MKKRLLIVSCLVNLLEDVVLAAYKPNIVFFQLSELLIECHMKLKSSSCDEKERERIEALVMYTFYTLRYN